MVIIGDSLIVAESFVPGLTAFDLGEDGVLTNRRPWATFAKAPPAFIPDGICVDSEGAIWVANCVGCEVLRIGEGGKILARVETSQCAFSCALGGADGRDLLIATAPGTNPGADPGESRGVLEIARVGVPG
jgi:sugar lactone lactonase YvrE